jgi:hypothetical protein
VEDGEGVSERGKRDDVAKASYKCLSIHEGEAWTLRGATVLKINALLRRSYSGSEFKIRRRHQRQIHHVQTQYFGNQKFPRSWTSS